MAVFSGNGAVGSPSFTFSSDTDTGMYRVGADKLGLVTNGTNALTIDSLQRVGIGDTGPDSIFTVTGGAIRSKNVSGDPGFDFYENGSGALIRQRNNRPLVFYVNNTEAGRFDEGESFLVGRTTPLTGRKAIVEGGFGVGGALTFQKFLADVPISTSTEILRATGFGDDTNGASAYRVTVMATFAGALTIVKEYIWIPQIIQTTGSRVLSAPLFDVKNALSVAVRDGDFTVTASKTGNDEILSITLSSSGSLAPSEFEVVVLAQGFGGRWAFTYPRTHPLS